MIHISKVLAVPATGALYFEDLSALQTDSRGAGDVVRGITEAVSVGLVLDDGRIAWGDCVGMPQGSQASRTTDFRSKSGLNALQHVVAPALEGRGLTGFRELAAEVETLQETVELTRPVPQALARGDPPSEQDAGVEDPSRRALLTAAARFLSPYPVLGTADKAQDDALNSTAVPTETITVQRQLHPAVRYGVSQALLQAMALIRGVTMAEVIAEEWDLPSPDAAVPIHAECGRERYLNVDKMIVRRIASLPGAFVDNVPEQIGDEGVNLSRYVRWLKERIQQLGGDDYRPIIHIDLNGALGQVFENNKGKMLGQLYTMEFAVQPHLLQVVDPMVMDGLDAQIEEIKTLRKYVEFRKMNVQLVNGAWVNTLDDVQAFIDAQAADVIHIKMPELGGVQNSVEAVLACRAQGVGAYLGGSPAETDLAARAAVHVALATRPDLLLAKPGVGVDEGVSLVQNEMARTLMWIRARR